MSQVAVSENSGSSADAEIAPRDSGDSRAPAVSDAVPNARVGRMNLVPSVCCLCGTDDADPVGVGEDFEYRTGPDTFLAVRCRQCGLVFLNPRPADGEAGRIYPDNYHAFSFDETEFGLIYRVRRWLDAQRLLKWCAGLPDDAKILDVGCGDGFHLRLLKDFGKPTWTLSGVDTDARAVTAAGRAGLSVQQAKVEDLDPPPGGFNLVLLIMTIEHLADPAAVLRSIRRLLAPGGRVGIITDNVGSPDFTLFGGRHWGGYHFPRHFTLFDKSTLARLAESADLRVEKIATAVSPVNWTYSLRNWVDDWRGPRWLVRFLSLDSILPLAFFTAMDMPLSWIGRGAILRASFVRESS
jgi:SAM-dependent methyltransferase